MWSVVKQPKLLITFLAAAPILSAFIAQHYYEISPFQLCIWQRWPYAVILFSFASSYLLNERIMAKESKLSTRSDDVYNTSEERRCQKISITSYTNLLIELSLIVNFCITLFHYSLIRGYVTWEMK